MRLIFTMQPSQFSQYLYLPLGACIFISCSLQLLVIYSRLLSYSTFTFSMRPLFRQTAVSNTVSNPVMRLRVDYRSILPASAFGHVHCLSAASVRLSRHSFLQLRFLALFFHCHEPYSTFSMYISTLRSTWTCRLSWSLLKNPLIIWQAYGRGAFGSTLTSAAFCICVQHT